MKWDPSFQCKPLLIVKTFLFSSRFLFDVGHFLKVFIEFVTMFLFYVLVFGLKACRILAPQPGIKPGPPEMEGKVLTSRVQGSPFIFHRDT